MARSRPTGVDALRYALARVLDEGFRGPSPLLAAGTSPGPARARRDLAGRQGWALSQAAGVPIRDAASPGPHGDHDLAASSATGEGEQQRLIALVELARGGDKEAFGLLYDHYHGSVYRFLYYRVGGVQVAEDLTAETFFRALRSMNNFRWQGRDFGAWLMTIARNLAADHFKSGRTRLEQTTEDMSTLDRVTDSSQGPESPENMVLAQLTNEAMLGCLRELPQDQQDCLVMRFLQGLSIAETAAALERSAGAIKQLQLRAVRNLAASLPEGLR